MQSALTLTRSTVGTKAVIAVTGLILFGFLIGHLAGNMLLYAGAEAYNEYAATLKANLPLLWTVRIVLLTSVIVHVALTTRIALRNRAARTDGYRKARKDQKTSYAALTMTLSGPIIALYIIFHIAHFTAPGIAFGHGEFSHTDVYMNAVHGFRVWWVSAIYIFANALVGFHLYHGIWSAMQSIGANHPRYNNLRRLFSGGAALVISGSNVVFPIAVQLRLIGGDI